MLRYADQLHKIVNNGNAFLTLLEHAETRSIEQFVIAATNAAATMLRKGVSKGLTASDLIDRMADGKQDYVGFNPMPGFVDRVMAEDGLTPRVKELLIANLGEQRTDIANELEQHVRSLEPAAREETYARIRKLLRAELAMTNAKQVVIEEELADAQRTRDHAKALFGGLDTAQTPDATWSKSTTPLEGYTPEFQARLRDLFTSPRPYILTRNDATRMHAFLSSGQWQNPGRKIDVKLWDPKRWKGYTSFLIQHDWARVFHDAEMPEDTALVTPPFEKTALEYRINDATIIHFISDDAVVLDNPTVVIVAIGMLDQWILIGLSSADQDPKLYHYLRKLSDRVLLALDAEVAIGELVPAPAKLNKKRIEKGKLPIDSYHLVKVRPRVHRDVRHRPTTTTVQEYKGVVRLHIRRGHWRRYESGTKVWVKSHLVGNPDLGFIEHDYTIGQAKQ